MNPPGVELTIDKLISAAQRPNATTDGASLIPDGVDFFRSGHIEQSFRYNS